ncbi:putative Zinc finger, BED-type [Corchorus olitorius]|uniref:Zinc finger, BED-type n=1 Tax=Corchorus olitorius TaxID=93759 RepID=A0A1R3HUK6_9ROSI|nr:putative Zinc finger, BED-type [Corchorus olitorius]
MELKSNEASIDVHDHGTTVKSKGQRVQCNYCGKEMSGFYRLKCHLGCIRGDVAPCERVPENVKELFRNQLQNKGRLPKEVKDLFQQDLPSKRNGTPGTNVSKKARRQRSESSNGESKECDENPDSMSESGLEEPETLARRSKVSLGAVTGDPQEDPSSRQNKKCIGRFVIEAGIDFKVVNSPSFQRMINDIHCPGQTRYNIPSCDELKGWILKDEVKEMQEYVKKIRQSWASTGCSILLDGWIDEKGRNLVNFIVDCPQGPIYLHSSDISTSVNDVNALQLCLDRIIEVVGAENVVQMIAFSTAGWAGAVGKQFEDRCKTVFWTVDASHCIELMLDKIAQMDEIRGTLETAKIISKFIHGNETVLNLFRDYSDGHDLIKPTKVRSAMPFVTLENIISEKNNLKAMFASSEWNISTWASRAEGKRVAEKVGDPSFWKGAGMLEAYRHTKGAFQEGSTIQKRTRYSPTIWWSNYGGEYPELQRLATRILSQTCVGASKYRLNRSLAEKLLTKGRSPIEQQLLSDLTFVHYNLQLQQQHSQLRQGYNIVADEIDPMDEWIVDDSPQIVSQNVDPARNELEGTGSTAVHGEVKQEPT